jgi:hypothetical protein
MKHTYVYQSKMDGKIYGDPQVWTPQQAGKVNAQNRRDGAFGVWLNASYLTEKELANKGNPEDAARHFSAACDGSGLSI